MSDGKNNTLTGLDQKCRIQTSISLVPSPKFPRSDFVAGKIGPGSIGGVQKGCNHKDRKALFSVIGSRNRIPRWLSDLSGLTVKTKICQSLPAEDVSIACFYFSFKTGSQSALLHTP